MLCDSNYLEQSDSETGRRMVNVGAGRNGQFFKWVQSFSFPTGTKFWRWLHYTVKVLDTAEFRECT